MTAAAPTVALVRLDQVVFHPHNVRQDLGDLRSLTASIQRHGVMQPVVVEKHAGSLRLRAGHRRVAAARIGGLTRVPAMIHEKSLDEEEWLIASIQENVHRTQLTTEERLRTARALIDLGCTRQGVADAFGVSLGAVGLWLNPTQKARHHRGTANNRVQKPLLRRRLADWRARDADRDTILSELEALCARPGAGEA